MWAGLDRAGREGWAGSSGAGRMDLAATCAGHGLSQGKPGVEWTGLGGAGRMGWTGRGKLFGLGWSGQALGEGEGGATRVHDTHLYRLGTTHICIGWTARSGPYKLG